MTWIVSVIFAAFLIAHGGKVIVDLPVHLEADGVRQPHADVIVLSARRRSVAASPSQLPAS